MLRPNQFQINQAWIVFRLSKSPIVTEQDGNFNVFALLDASSCFIMATMFVRVEDAEPSQLASVRFLKDGYSHYNQYPETLYIPSKERVDFLSEEAESHGIEVVRIPEKQLLPFIGDARKMFKKFGMA